VLRTVDWQLVTDIPGQPIHTICKGQAEAVDCLTLEDGTDWLYRNVCNYQPMLRKSHKSESLIYTAAEA
jgi:hypothetical protein